VAQFRVLFAVLYEVCTLSLIFQRGTPEAASGKDAGGIFSAPQVPSQEGEPIGEA